MGREWSRQGCQQCPPLARTVSLASKTAGAATSPRPQEKGDELFEPDGELEGTPTIEEFNAANESALAYLAEKGQAAHKRRVSND